MPTADSVQGYYNVITGCSGTGSSLSVLPGPISTTHQPTRTPTASQRPNLTLNTGADITLTNSLVSTTRLGYFFDNYHDIGYPTSGVIDEWETNGAGVHDGTNGVSTYDQRTLHWLQDTGHVNGAMSQNFTHFNSNKATQFDEDIAWFKSGSRIGTHNLKFGYQLHRNVNLISQGYNEPDIQVYPGTSGPYTPIDPECRR